MRPSTTDELADMISGAKTPLCIQGGGTRGMAGQGDVLSVAGLSGITLYEPGALTMVAQAGTPVLEVEAALAKENQRLAFEPMDHRGLLGSKGTPTIGGVFAANVSGPRRIAVGAARDFLLGVKFVDGRGEVIKNGGRVMKNVTGYDLVKLMAGSFGTLGVLSEVSLKVLPSPETEGTLVVQGLSDGDAVRALSQAMGSPFEVTGAAHDPATGRTVMRVEGFEASVQYRTGRLRDLLAGFGAEMEVLEADASAALWADLRDVSAFHSEHGDVWRVSCKPSDAPALAAMAGAEAHYFDWAGGLMWMRTAPDSDVRAKLGSFDGHATIVKASEETRATLGVFQPEAAGVAKITAGLRARFDPKGLFSAGLMDASA